MVRHALPIYMLVSMILWFFYRSYLMPDVDLILHSDSAVPYMTTIEPWLPQDFFFWSAERFGSLAAIPWKVVGKGIFGTSAKSFYDFHFAYFFIGHAFWMAAIGAPVLALAFLLLMLPLTEARADLFLLPGHLYGALYLFMGIIFYLLLKKPQPSRRSGVILGMCVAACYWQHALVGVIMGGYVLLKYVCMPLTPTPPGEERARIRQTFLPFLVVLAFLGWQIEIARRWAFEWAGPYYFHFEDWAVFRSNMQDFLTRGLSFQIGAAFGLALVAAVIIGLLLSLRLIRKGSGSLFLRLFVPSVFALTLALIIMFNDHPRYTVSGRAERYFTFVIPMIFLALTQLPRLSSSRRIKAFGPAVLALLVALTAYRAYTPANDLIFDPGYLNRRQADAHDRQRRISVLLAAGCHNVVDDYWHAYVLTALTNGSLPASPTQDPRNPVLFRRIMNSDNFCIGSGAERNRAVNASMRLRRCTMLDFQYVKCDRIAGPPPG